MAQKVRHTPLPESLVYTSGATVSKTIPQGMLIRQLVLKLKLTITTSSNMAAAAIAAGAEWGLVKKLSIRAGTEVIREFTGEELRLTQAIFCRQFPRPGIALGATSTAVESTLILPFWDLLSRKPMDTVLNSSGYGNLNITIQWGAPTDIASTATAVTGQIDGTIEYSTGADPKMLIYETRVSRLEVTTISGASTDYGIPLLTGLVALRGALIYAKDSSGNDASGLITNVKLKSLSTNVVEGTFAGLRDQAFANLGLRELIASGAASSPMQDSQFALSNYLWLDMCKDGYLSEALPTYNLGDLRLQLTTTAAISTLVIVHFFIVPPTTK